MSQKMRIDLTKVFSDNILSDVINNINTSQNEDLFGDNSYIQQIILSNLLMINKGDPNAKATVHHIPAPALGDNVTREGYYVDNIDPESDEWWDDDMFNILIKKYLAINTLKHGDFIVFDQLAGSDNTGTVMWNANEKTMVFIDFVNETEKGSISKQFVINNYPNTYYFSKSFDDPSRTVYWDNRGYTPISKELYPRQNDHSNSNIYKIIVKKTDPVVIGLDEYVLYVSEEHIDDVLTPNETPILMKNTQMGDYFDPDEGNFDPDAYNHLYDPYIYMV